MSVAAQRTVSAVNTNGLQAVLSELSVTGAAVLTIDGASVRDEQTLLEQIRRDIDFDSVGLDPPRGWNGLKDAMWTVVGAQNNEQVVLLWFGADTILAASLADFLLAIEVFTAVAEDALNRTTGVGRVRFQLVLVGDGPMFPPYEHHC